MRTLPGTRRNPLLLFSLTLFAALLLATSCGDEGPDTTRDTGAADVDGGGDTCVPDCDGKQCGGNGCGGQCGTCQGTLTCNAAGQCVCPESDEAFCARLESCAHITDKDSCGLSRTVDCPDNCATHERCDVESARCVCVPETDTELCTAAEVACGALSVTDRCGVKRTPTCPDTCTGFDLCVGNECVCQGESAAQLCAAHEKDCGPYQVENRCGVVVAIDCDQEDAPCESPKICTANVCRLPFPPPHDTCENAEPLTLMSGQISFEVDNSIGTNTLDGSCNTNSGRELFFKVLLKAKSSLTLQSDPIDSAVWPAIQVRSGCGKQDVELGCGTTTAHTPLELIVPEAGPGWIIIALDSAKQSTNGSGLQRLTIQATPLADLLNDQCDAPTPLPDASDLLSHSFTGSTAGALPSDASLSGRCGITGPDVYYSFTPSAESWMRISAHATSANAYLPTIALLGDCGGADESELACSVQAAPLAPASLVIQRLVGGETYLLRVGGTSALPGTFEVTFDFQPVVESDSCATADLLDIDGAAGQKLAIRGSTYRAMDDEQSGCAPLTDLSGPDIIYQFEVPPGPTRSVRISLSPQQGSAYMPRLSVRRNCTDPASQLYCDFMPVPDAVLHTTLFGLSPDTYSIIVDTIVQDRMSFTGPFLLEVAMPRRGAPPVGDTCASADAKRIVGDKLPLSVHLDGTTVDAADTWNPSNCMLAVGGPDVVYPIEVRENSALFAYVSRTATSPDYQPALYLLRECGNEEEIIRCAENSAAAKSSLEIDFLPPATYYLVVDGRGRSEGDFKLDLYLLSPSHNATCDVAREIEFNEAMTAEVVSNNAWGEGTVSSTCGEGVSGKDLVWYFEVPQGKTLNLAARAARLPGSKMEPNISLRRYCDQRDNGSELACAAKKENPGDPNWDPDVLSAQFTANKLTEGTYWIWVDGYRSGSDGPFKMELALSDSERSLYNLCGEAPPIALEPDGTATLRGSTIMATNDVTPRCASTTAGSELVYHLKLTGRKNVVGRLTVDEGSALDPILYVREACDAPVDLVCSGAQRTFQLHGAEGDYYIYVDSRSAAREGAFTLRLETEDAGPALANDTCDDPERILLDPVTHSRTITDLTTAGYGHHYSGLCASSSAPHSGSDLTFEVYVDAPSRITARVRKATSDTSGYVPVVYIRSTACTSTSSFDEVACAVGVGGIATAVGHAEVGTHYIIVDGLAGEDGVFALDISTEPEPKLPDTCATAEKLTLPLPGQNPVVFRSYTDLAVDNSASGSLGMGTGPDLVYYFDLTAATTVEASLTFASTEAPAVLYLRKECNNPDRANEYAAASAAKGGPASFAVTLGEGRWFLWVDSQHPMRGEFELSLETHLPPQAPPATTCAELSAAPAATFSNYGKWTVQHSTYSVAAGATVGNDSGCSGATGPEAVYAIEIPAGAARSLTATVVRGPSSAANFAPLLYLRTACDTVGSEVKCAPASSSGATIAIQSTTASKYYLFVDSAGAGDEYVLSVSLDWTYADTCIAEGASAPELALTNGHVDFSGTNALASPNLDATAVCGGGTGGNDVLYKVVFTEGEVHDPPWDMLIQLTATGSSIIVVQKGNCVSGTLAANTNYACSYSTGVSTSKRFPVTTAGDYWIWIDARSISNIGPFSGSIDYLPPERDNALCNAADIIEPTFINGFASFIGNTMNGNAISKGDTTCGQSTVQPPATKTSRELVYKLPAITVPAGGSAFVEATVTPIAGTAYRPIVELRSDCGTPSTASGWCLAATSSKPVSIIAEVKQSGTYYLWVDTYGSTTAYAGAFTATVAIIDGNTPVPDTCADYMPLPTFVSGLASIDGTMSKATHNETGGCAAMSGPDLVYSFTLGAQGGPRSVTAVVKGSTTFTAPALYIRSTACEGASAQEVACSVGSASTARTLAPALPPGTYYIFVDSTATATGTFTLTVKTDEPINTAANTSCQILTPIELHAGRASIEVPLGIASGARYTSGNCKPTPGPDLIYALQLPANTRLQATVTPAPTTDFSGFIPTVYIRSACASSILQDELACVAGSTLGAPVTATAITNGSLYTYIFVDAADQYAHGAFRLDISAAPLPFSPENDRCHDPFPASAEISFIGDKAAFGGTLADATNDTTGTCESLKMKGPDKVYRFSLTQPSSVTAKAIGAGFKPSLYLRAGCNDVAEASHVACDKGTGNTSTLSIDYLPGPAEYYLWIDTVDENSAGPFWIELALEAPRALPPANDACTGELELLTELSGALPDTGERILTATRTGELSTAANHSVGSGDCALANGPDLVYAFDIAEGQPRMFSAKLLTLGAFKGALYLRTHCDSGDNFGKSGCFIQDLPSTTNPPTVSHNYLTPGRYYLWVDSRDATSRGAFTLEASVKEVVGSIPRIASCVTPSQLTPFSGTPLSSVTTLATAIGNIAPVESTSTGPCMYSPGPDFVYALLLPNSEPKKVTISVNTAALDVYLRRDCADSSMVSTLGCSKSPAGATSLVFPKLTPLPDGKPYYLFVDFEKADATGNFTLTVTLNDPVDPPANDTCAGAIPLSLDVPVPGTTVNATNDYPWGRSRTNTDPCTDTNLPKGIGPDVVYTYTPQSAYPFKIVLDTSASSPAFDATFWIGTDCADQFSCIGGGSDSATLDAATIANPTPGKTYYIFVNGKATKYGNFVITATTP